MKSNNQFLLLKTRRFAPLFVTQFLGAFHDNVFKNAFVVMLLFGGMIHTLDPKLLTTLAAGVFIFPFVIFSALGGQLADKFAKEKVMRIIKLVEIVIALLGAVSLFSGSVVLSFTTLFALGTHSAFFSPAKYSILPQHLEARELIGGNALVNTGTFLAILFGTLAGTILITFSAGNIIISALLVASALSGYCSSRFIPSAPPPAPDFKLNLNPLTETWDILCQIFLRPRQSVLCILGISWFWYLGSIFLAQLPNYTKETLHADEHVLSFLLVLFSVGIAAGGLLNNKLLKGRLQSKYVPFSMLGLTLFSLDLYIASDAPGVDAQGFYDFINAPQNWRIIFDFVMIALCGGLFVVPLNAILQHKTPDAIRARILAGSTIMNALMMVAASIDCTILIALGFNIPQLFVIFALANAMAALYLMKYLKPDADA